jgi:hypothetical protein
MLAKRAYKAARPRARYIRESSLGRPPRPAAFRPVRSLTAWKVAND